MNHNYRFADVNDALPALCRHLLGEDEVGSRLGDRTKEKTFVGIRLSEPMNREILLPSRKANIAAQIAETMWVLSGRDDVAWLRHYLPRAEDFSDDGERWRGAYGPRLRKWHRQERRTDSKYGFEIDQLQHVVDLLKEDPNTRRAVMTIYDPARDSEPGKDIPCNNWLSFLSRNGFLDLHVAIRSNDLIWGWSGINQFEWSVLLEVVASLTDLTPGHLHFSTTSLHLYDRHYDRAEEIGKDSPLDAPKDSPRFNSNGFTDHLGGFDRLAELWFGIEDAMRRGSAIWAEVRDFPEPMLRSWLQVLGYYWSGEKAWLQGLEGTRLYHAALLTKPKMVFNEPEPAEDASGFVKALGDLHAEKHAAYGNSWKARGELFSILPNIARKVDRLGTGKETADETTADTAADLLIYLLKYRLWLTEQVAGVTSGMDHPTEVKVMLLGVNRDSHATDEDLVLRIRQQFDALLVDVEERVDINQKANRVDALTSLAGPLAYRLWHRANNDEPEERMHAEADDYEQDRQDMVSARWLG